MANINPNENTNGSNNDTLILFYHEESKPCQKLKEFLPKDKKIQMVDISKVQNIPASIKSVPTLVVNNKDILSGKKVFEFFNKKDEIEYLTLSGKNSGFTFSSIDDNDSSITDNSTSLYSSLDMPSMSDGVPKWEDDNVDKGIDIDKLQSERDTMFKSIQRQ